MNTKFLYIFILVEIIVFSLIFFDLTLLESKADKIIYPSDFSSDAIKLGFDELNTPYDMCYISSLYPKGEHFYGDPVKDTYKSLGVYFDDDDRPANSTGVGEKSSPNSLAGGLPWNLAPTITVYFVRPVKRVGAWAIDSGVVGSPAGNEVVATFYDMNGNKLRDVFADPDYVVGIDSSQFLGFESNVGIARVTFNEHNRSGDQIDDFFIDDLIFEVEPIPEPSTILMLITGFGSISTVIFIKRHKNGKAH